MGSIRNKSIATNFLSLLLFIILAAIAARPVLAELDKVIVGQDSDVPMNLWADWWTGLALSDPEISLWKTDYLFYPQGREENIDLTFHSFSHFNSLVSLGLRPLLGILPAYNLAILLNYVLAGWAMYHLARYLTANSMSAILAGIVFAFNSHNQYQSAHPALISIWVLPWVTLYFMRAVRENRQLYAAVAALFIFLAAITSTLLLVMTALWLTILISYMFFVDDWPRPQSKILLLFFGLSALLAMPLLYPLLREFLINRNSSFLISADEVLYITDIGLPIVPHWYVWSVRGLYLGLMPILLLIIARYSWKKSRLWYLLFFVSYLLTIGPYPTFFGRPLNITLPWSLPVVPLIRNPYRLNILLSLGLAMLVAYGWRVMQQHNLRTRRTQLAAGILVAGLIFVDYTAPHFPMTRIDVSTFYTDFLPAEGSDAALALIPSSRHLGKAYMFYQTQHQRPMTGGTISRSREDAFTFVENHALLRAGMADRPAMPLPLDVSSQLESLAAADIGYLVLNKSFMGEDLETWRRLLPFRPVYEDDQVAAFATRPKPGRDYERIWEVGPSLGLVKSDIAVTGEKSLLITLGWIGSETLPGKIDYRLQVLTRDGQIVASMYGSVGPQSTSWKKAAIFMSQDRITVEGAPGPLKVSLSLVPDSEPDADAIIVGAIDWP